MSDRQQARLDAIVRANQGLSGPKVAAKFAEMTGLKIYPYAVARARKRLGLPPSSARCNWKRKAVAS